MNQIVVILDNCQNEEGLAVRAEVHHDVVDPGAEEGEHQGLLLPVDAEGEVGAVVAQVLASLPPAL